MVRPLASKDPSARERDCRVPPRFRQPDVLRRRAPLDRGRDLGPRLCIARRNHSAVGPRRGDDGQALNAARVSSTAASTAPAPLGRILCGYGGSILMAGAFLAITCMTSAVTRNQVVSFILSVVVCLFLILCSWPPVTDSVVNWAPAWLVDTLADVGVMTHYEGFQRGVIDSRDLIFFFSMIAFFLFTTSVILRTRRA